MDGVLTYFCQSLRIHSVPDRPWQRCQQGLCQNFLWIRILIIKIRWSWNSLIFYNEIICTVKASSYSNGYPGFMNWFLKPLLHVYSCFTVYVQFSPFLIIKVITICPESVVWNHPSCNRISFGKSVRDNPSFRTKVCHGCSIIPSIIITSSGPFY